MLAKPIFRNWCLYLSILFFLIGVSFHLYQKNIDYSKYDYFKYQSSLEKNISSYFEAANRDFTKLDTLEDSRFLSQEYETSFLILSRNQVVYWTSNELLATEESLKNLKSGYNQLTNGKYLIKKRQLKKDKRYTVYFFLELFKEYPLENQYISHTWNENVFGEENKILIFPPKKESPGVVTLNEEPAFGFQFTGKVLKSKTPYYFYVLGVLLLSLFVFNQSNVLLKKGYEFPALLSFLTYLIALKLVVNYSGIFVDVFHFDLFTSEYYSPSLIANSFGDLLINLILSFLAFYYIYHVFFRKNEIRLLRNTKTELAMLILVVLCTSCFYFLDIFHSVLENIYIHSSLNFDVTKNINLDKYELVYLFIFLLFSLTFLFLTRIFLKVSVFFSQKSFKSFLLILLIGAGLYLFPGLFFGYFNVLSCVLCFLYLAICYRYDIYKHIKKFRFYSYIYMIFTASVCALIGAETVSRYSTEQDILYQKDFAEKLVVNDDFEAEYLLSQINKKITEELPKSSYSNVDTTAMLKQIKNEIHFSYLEHYFEQFDVNIYFFNAEGNSLNANEGGMDYLEYKSKFANPKFKTQFNDLYFVNFYDHGDYSKYISFIELPETNGLINTLVIELISDKLSPNSVYPRLLGDRKIYENRYFDNFSYCVFSREKLLFSSGNYNYRFWEFEPLLKTTEDYYFFYESEGLRHLVYQGVDNKVVVVSVEDKELYSVFTNFSFLLLILLFCIIISFVLYIGFANAFNTIPSYSTRIHLYLNFIYLLAIVSISAVMLKWVSVEYEIELKNDFRNEAEEIGRHATRYLELYEEGELNNSKLNQSLKRLSNYSGTDLNLYDSDGKLIFTSQPLIYNNGLVSNLMNPTVLKSIFYQKHSFVNLDENVGGFKYHNVYLSLSSYQDDHLLGVLSIPFLDSFEELQARKVDLVNAILNVFTLVFIVVLFISYVAFVNITGPLKSISQTIKETSLTGNKYIDWKAEDEIGLIVNEYNRMINKLEESKRIFEQSKKEDAWREMARQVAHEIKNPLTPMSLKIQQLKRVSDPEDTRLKETLDSLLLQIDTLSDIATSFSAFSKMPEPEFQKFDIVSLLNDTLLIFEGEEAEVIRNFKQIPTFVFADKKLLGRVINNLVLNAIQSVTHHVKPLVIVDIEILEDKIRLSITDNGEGIPDDIKTKVFQPNFSTKYTGSGIGLAVAKKAIEQADGNIWFDSTIGKGTSFYIELPRMEDYNAS